ncbi:hypothetical protein BBJ28_00021044 [Nothophytophthora sp. Chile5]|nr:hypothetical protein BBJ28_00021044 [Nothophytophthora sp. Chile5]
MRTPVSLLYYLVMRFDDGWEIGIRTQREGTKKACGWEEMAATPRRERLAVLMPMGEVFVNGLASSYDDEFPESTRLESFVTREDFAKAIATINDALLDHWPCLPCKGFAYGCCVCTLGLSFYCAATQVQEAEGRLQLQLRRLNAQSKFKSRGVQWRLERSWWRRSSFVEIYVDLGVAAAALASSSTADVDNVASASGKPGEPMQPVHETTMSDRLV